uniref:E3 ubiquitin-protein ligase parkin n=1 Tax=Erigeron canadensis TaxID=72917 RepID=UPI001CB8BB7A|nr:E3 ubiquitin-protein ligase parkin [Erigeron canadensis]XP_043632797.1 E3 ubiquitin-protein ligase parkin [Erigeron canadensis]
MELKLEEDEDEFRSCCGDEEELNRDETGKQGLKNGNDDEFLDEFWIRMFFKGVSITDPGNNGFNVSGIGVVMERADKVPIIQVQKKLEFFVDESVADYLALMDGLLEATRNNIKRVFAFTDSATLFDQITKDETLENPLLIALKQRILEHVENLEHFDLKCVPGINLEESLRLAQVAVGIVHLPIKGDSSVKTCSVCCEDKPTPMTITMKCSHKFCSCCIKAYVDEQVQSSQIPVKCPHSNCRYYISTPELKSFLPVASYALLDDSLSESNLQAKDKFYCPFTDCAVLLDPCCDSNHSDNNCVECPVCRRFICVKCGVPWHSSVSCDEFQDLPPQGRGNGDDLDNRRWRQCRMCERMIELTHGCYHMTCWCGHEFCYSCGTEYTESEQTCACTLLDSDEGGDNNDFSLTQNFSSSPALEEWAWDSCGTLSNLMDAYSEQERSQLALIQRFLAGGFSLGDHHTYTYQAQSPPPPCTDSDSAYLENTMKDLHQLPWLERFVSVIDDNYYDQYTQ